MLSDEELRNSLLAKYSKKVPEVSEELELPDFENMAKEKILVKSKIIKPEQLHSWYLEIVKILNPENYNEKANIPYEELKPEQKAIDKYIADKINAFLGLTTAIPETKKSKTLLEKCLESNLNAQNSDTDISIEQRKILLEKIGINKKKLCDLFRKN